MCVANHPAPTGHPSMGGEYGQVFLNLCRGDKKNPLRRGGKPEGFFKPREGLGFIMSHFSVIVRNSSQKSCVPPTGRYLTRVTGCVPSKNVTENNVTTYGLFESSFLKAVKTRGSWYITPTGCWQGTCGTGRKDSDMDPQEESHAAPERRNA